MTLPLAFSSFSINQNKIGLQLKIKVRRVDGQTRKVTKNLRKQILRSKAISNAFRRTDWNKKTIEI